MRLDQDINAEPDNSTETKTRSWMLACALSLLVVASACGTSTDQEAAVTSLPPVPTNVSIEEEPELNPEEQELIDSMVDETLAYQQQVGWPVPDSEVRCWAEQMLDEFGVEGLGEMGFGVDDSTTDGLPNTLDGMTLYVTALVDCVSLREMVQALPEAECWETATDDEFKRAATHLYMSAHDEYLNPEEQAFVDSLGVCPGPRSRTPAHDD